MAQTRVRWVLDKPNYGTLHVTHIIKFPGAWLAELGTRFGRLGQPASNLGLCTAIPFSGLLPIVTSGSKRICAYHGLSFWPGIRNRLCPWVLSEGRAQR